MQGLLRPIRQELPRAPHLQEEVWSPRTGLQPCETLTEPLPPLVAKLVLKVRMPLDPLHQFLNSSAPNAKISGCTVTPTEEAQTQSLLVPPVVPFHLQTGPYPCCRGPLCPFCQNAFWRDPPKLEVCREKHGGTCLTASSLAPSTSEAFLNPQPSVATEEHH